MQVRIYLSKDEYNDFIKCYENFLKEGMSGSEMMMFKEFVIACSRDDDIVEDIRCKVKEVNLQNRLLKFAKHIVS